MQILIVATSATLGGIADQIRQKQHYRIDYLDLSQRFATEYVDYNAISNCPPVRQIEETLRVDLRLALYVARLVCERRYDAVVSMSERVGIPLSYLLDRSVRQVVILHHPLSPLKLRMLRWFGVLRHCHRVVAISHAEAAALREALDLGPEQVQVLNTPVDTDFFQPLGPLPPATEPDHVESLGLSYRDYPTLLAAMRLLPHIPCHLRVGSAWVGGNAGIRRSAIPPNVTLKPFVHPRVLRDCYRLSRFIVVPLQPTTQWSAGCTSVQQAQAMGRAVIATALPGLSDYVRDRETGLLIAGGAPAALAEAINELWRHPAWTEAMGRRARAWVEETFSLDKWLDDMADLVCAMETA
jgi:glycosyltransferase involved in cell wall biosynthesis